MQSAKTDKTQQLDYEELQNTLLCAHWLVHQFENLELQSIANLFQQALNDTESWLETMSNTGIIDYQCLETVKEREAKAIHNILIKYASIENKEIREGILGEMLRITKQSYN